MGDVQNKKTVEGVYHVVVLFYKFWAFRGIKSLHSG